MTEGLIRRYILGGEDGHTPIPCPDLLEWGRAFESDRRVRLDGDAERGIYVSTVFLGLDHNWGRGPPLLFETMVFRDRHGDECQRYATWDEAVAGHYEMCRQVGVNYEP